MMNQHGSSDPRDRTSGRSWRRVLLTSALTALLALGSPTLGTTTAQAAKASTTQRAAARALAPYVYEARVQRMINRRRANHDLGRLRFSACADRTAERWSRRLAARDAFYHQSMWNVLERCNARYAGETLGRGGMRPAKLVRMWMRSPGHRAILLSTKARRVGIGATRDGSGWVVAANFIRP
jgi:uncharacterized protein YkwD